MTTAASVNPAELTALVTGRYVGAYFEARLLYAPGTSYEPGTSNPATFLSNELAVGVNGYQRQVISYTQNDVSAYTDLGVGLVEKAAVFDHDGTATTLDFTHCALVWGDGQAIALSAGTTPATMVDGVYTGFKPTTVSGSGSGLEVTLTISSNAVTDVTVTQAGSGYTTSSVLEIPEAELEAAGVTAVGSGLGSLGLGVDTIYQPANAGELFSVAETANEVNLSGGNQAVFYFNLKQFGFYN